MDTSTRAPAVDAFAAAQLGPLTPIAAREALRVVAPTT